MLRRIFCIIWLVALLPGICTAGEVKVKKLNKQDWINIETGSFNLLTNEVYGYMSKWALTGWTIRIGEGSLEFPNVKYQRNDITTKEAVNLYEKAVHADAFNPNALNGLAWFLVTVPDTTLRDPQRAITLAGKAVEIERSANILDTLAEAYYVAGSFQKAIEAINEAIALDPEREYLREQLEKFTEALEEA